MEERFPRMRARAVGAVVVALVSLSVAPGGGTSGAPTSPAAFAAAERAPARARTARASDIAWHGGWVTASTGEQLRIYVSDSLTPAHVSPQQWADFFGRLVHGAELPLLTVWIATMDEISGICGERASGCYGQQQLYMPGDSDQREVIAVHEYAHHVEHNRLNSPWAAETYGPKRWATVEKICARAASGTVFPGDEDAHYMLNPGEGYAEAYRVLNALGAGAPVTWGIVDWSFYPDAEALLAAEADVDDPWAPVTTTVRRRFAAKTRSWTLNVASSLDGTLEVDVSTGRVVPFDVRLLSADRRTVLARGVRIGPKERQLRYTICGRRSFVVRVASQRALGVTSVRVTKP